MSDLSEKLIAIKNALLTALGDNESQYYNFLRLWFRHIWTREEFDVEARKLLPPEQAHLHNKFMIAILNKIGSLCVPNQQTSSLYSTTPTRSNRKRKRSSRFNTERATFEPYDLYDYLKDENLDAIKPPNASGDSSPPIPAQRYCVQEYFLPDPGFIMGRLLVGAWESGLVNVEDAVAEYVSTAVQILLKNILSSIILKRKHYRVTSDGAYFYDVGHSIKDPFVRNTVTKQKIDDAPLEIDKEMTTMNVVRKTSDDSVFLSVCEEVYPQKKSLITVNDVYKALLDRNVILSHSVHSVNMERLAQLLH